MHLLVSTDGAWGGGSPPPPPHPPDAVEFILDSGASDSCFRDAGDVRLLSTPHNLHGADSSFTVFVWHASILPCSAFPTGTATGLHVPTFCHNLLSQSALQRAGVTTVFPANASHCDLFHSGSLLARFHLSPFWLYSMRVLRRPPPSTSSPTPLAAAAIPSPPPQSGWVSFPPLLPSLPLSTPPPSC